MHIFPDHKKYIGCTGQPVRTRWAGGLGYSGQSKVFSAIVKFGWENISHYILFENLDKDTAYLIEAALIRKLRTYQKGRGYNVTKPLVDGADEFVVPDYERKRIKDEYDDPFSVRMERYFESPRRGSPPCSRKVRCIETGQIFQSTVAASRFACVSDNSVSQYIKRASSDLGKNHTCGYVINDDGICVRAHWEYVDD